MGLPIWALESAELVDLLVDRAALNVPTRVCYVNAHSWNVARRDRGFHDLLTSADVLYADGMSLVWASRLLGRPLPARLSSADYAGDFARACAERDVSVYLLGGAGTVAERAADRLIAEAPGLRVAGVADGYFDPTDGADVVDRINRANPDLLLVGMGSPWQERWSAERRDALNVPVIWCVGALFDYLADVEPRAPRWMSRNGLEWVYRLTVDPRGKAERYLLGNPRFVASLVRTRMRQGIAGRGRRAAGVDVR